MAGDEFMDVKEAQDGWLAWAKAPGHALVLLPPYSEGLIARGLDWHAVLLPTSAPIASGNSPSASIVSRLANEVCFELRGLAGTSDLDEEHLWRDGTVNTRYWKSHANSGLLAATCLPLWSISLLGQSGQVLTWLRAIYGHVGRPGQERLEHATPSIRVPSAEEWAVLVCCYAFGVGSAEGVREAIANQAAPVMRLDGYDLATEFANLRSCGWLADNGPSDAGLALLRDGPFWRYAEQLKRMARP